MNELASAAGQPCDIDPMLCSALRTLKSGQLTHVCLCVLRRHVSSFCVDVTVGVCLDWLQWLNCMPTVLVHCMPTVLVHCMPTVLVLCVCTVQE